MVRVSSSVDGTVLPRSVSKYVAAPASAGYVVSVMAVLLLSVDLLRRRTGGHGYRQRERRWSDVVLRRHAGGARLEVAPLRDAQRSPGCEAVAVACSDGVSRDLEQVRADGVHPVVPAEGGVTLDRSQLAQSGLRAVDHRDCDDAI